MLIHVLVIIIISYLIGSIPFAYIISRMFKGIDIRNYGSGNMGATNVWRSVGKIAAILTLVLDIFKGFFPVYLTLYFYSNSGSLIWVYAITASIAVIFGHNWPVFLRFKGGKGVAASCGVFIALVPKALVVSFIIFIIIIYFSGYISLGSILAGLMLPLIVWYFGYDVTLIIFSSFIAVLIIVRHRANIKRLIQGNENKFK